MADATSVAAQDTLLESMPIDIADIISGTPEAAGKVLFVDDTNGTCSGLWECTPGKFEWSYDANETVAILNGRATVDCADGTRVELQPGSYAVFRRGTRAMWTVHETIRKVFVLH